MADFKKRISAPSSDNPYFYHYTKGGYNPCLVIDQKSGSVMPNCVGYTNGRLQELNGKRKVDWRIPAGNPNTWIDYAKKNGLKTGTEPRLGAVAVWTGHVANIEAIDVEGNILVGQSHYNGVAFDMCTIKRTGGYMYNGQRLLGFIYPDIDYGTGDFGKQTTTETANPKVEKYFAKSGSYGVLNNAKNQMLNLARAGYHPTCYYDGTYYRIKVAGFETREEALKLVNELKSKGFGACLETKIDGRVVTL